MSARALAYAPPFHGRTDTPTPTPVDNTLSKDQPDFVPMLVHLARCGFTPACVLDLGAFHGEVSWHAHRIWPDAVITMVEPNPDKAGILNVQRQLCGPRAQVVQALLSDSVREVPFYLSEGGSSYLIENTTFPKPSITLLTNTLDAVTDCRVPGPYLLKLDVQGAERDVLEGGRDTLRKVEVAIIECSTLEYNQGAPTFADMVAYMSDAGFAVYDICGQWRRQTDNALFQVDVVFVRADSLLRQRTKFWLTEPDSPITDGNGGPK